MNVHLTPELEQLVQSRVQSGRYGSASEVVRDALRLLADRDELAELRKQELRKRIAQGLESLHRGEGIDGDEFFSQLERDEAMLESKRPA
jgi:antitoxin ParD1/3/4